MLASNSITKFYHPIISIFGLSLLKERDFFTCRCHPMAATWQYSNQVRSLAQFFLLAFYSIIDLPLGQILSPNGEDLFPFFPSTNYLVLDFNPWLKDLLSCFSDSMFIVFWQDFSCTSLQLFSILKGQQNVIGLMTKPSSNQFPMRNRLRLS